MNLNNNDDFYETLKTCDSSSIQQKMITTARSAFSSGKTRSYSFRLNQLKRLNRMMIEGQEEICKALALDLRKSKTEAYIEIGYVRIETDYQIRNLKSNMAAERPIRGVTMWLAGVDAFVQREPYGVVAIIGPWNFPVMLVLTALAGAIAAGNCVIVKHSELSSNTSATLTKLMSKYLDNECYQSLETDVEGSKEFLTHKFNFIFFIGSTRVGKIVMEAASKHLTPVHLELGGKSPVYIDDSSDIEVAVFRIFTSKCLNLGQMCLAPDYVICSKKVQEEFVRVAKRLLNKHLGSNQRDNPGLSRIINKFHFERLIRLLKTTTGRVVVGGDYDESDKWISPTIIADVCPSDAIMQEEIFGPLLPIITVETPEDALAEITSRTKPLAFYIFSKNEDVSKMLVENVSCGGICVNDICPTFPHLPFGGVGESGMGAYFWKHTFEAFSHKKSVVRVGQGWPINKFDQFRLPPHSDKLIGYGLKLLPGALWILNAFMNFNTERILSYLLVFMCGLIISHYIF